MVVKSRVKYGKPPITFYTILERQIYDYYSFKQLFTFETITLAYWNEGERPFKKFKNIY